MKRTVVLLGSTGRVGGQALEVLAAHPDRFTVTALAASGADLALAAEQAVRFEAEALALTAGDRREAITAVDRARSDLGIAARPEVLVGPEAAATVAGAGVDVVVNGLTGSAGLAPTLAGLRAGSALALANRESLVAGGPLVRAARVRPDQLVPVESAHAAIAQALRGRGPSEIARLVLTASGGPFHGRTRAELEGVSPRETAAHVPGSTSPASTIDAATLMTTGLEILGAHVLFDVPSERIEAVVHPQSVVHAMVEFVDGSRVAHAWPPDTRLPVDLALGPPDRPGGAVDPQRWEEAATWTFEPVDHDAFPAIGLCRAALAASVTHPAVLHAANEEAVAGFLAGRLPFPSIMRLVAHVLDDHEGIDPGGLDLERLLEVEQWARGRARELIDAGRHR